MAHEIGERLTFYLEREGMSQRELAKRAGVTEAAISRYVKGAREPRAITVAALAKGLGVTVNDLVGAEVGPLDEAYEMVARNAHDISEERKKRLIKILLDS